MKLDFLKIDINILDDSKIKIIRKYPGGSDFFLLWVWLLCTAMKSETPGYIYITSGVPYRLDDIAGETDLEFKTVEEGLKLFEKYRMIEFINGGIIEIINFNKHQKLDQIEKARITSRETSQRYRERQKKALFDGDVSLTKSDKTDTDTDTDTEKKPPVKSKDLTLYLPLSKLLYTEHLKGDPGYLKGKDLDKTFNTWGDSIRKLCEIDHRPIDQIRAVILWAKSNTFWSPNIMSGSKLRKQYPTLLAQMSKDKVRGQPKGLDFSDDDYYKKNGGEF